MGKLTWTFDTTDPDDRYDIAIHHKAEAMRRTICDVDDLLRAKVKHCADEWPEPVYNFLEDLREILWATRMVDIDE